jgi:uncharacterized protein YjbJ (UPF0337 family)
MPRWTGLNLLQKAVHFFFGACGLRPQTLGTITFETGRDAGDRSLELLRWDGTASADADLDSRQTMRRTVHPFGSGDDRCHAEKRGDTMADTVEAQQPQQGAAEQAQEKVQEVAGQAREKAQEGAAEARSRMQQQVDQRSTQAGEQMSSAGSDLRSVGNELRNQGKDKPARLADQAADRVERVGSYLVESDADRILHDVEDFGRRQPLAVLAGGMVLGIAAARFLKASSSRRHQVRTAGSNGASHAPFPAPRADIGTPEVRPAVPDAGEHHQRFEGHS